MTHEITMFLQFHAPALIEIGCSTSSPALRLDETKLLHVSSAVLENAHGSVHEQL